MVRRLVTTLTAAAIGAVGVIAVATPAQAAFNCRTLVGCLYQNANGTGGVREEVTFNRDFAGDRFNNGVGLNDQTTSVENADPDYYFDLSEHRNNGGFTLMVLPGQQLGNLGSYSFNDEASSLEFQ